MDIQFSEKDLSLTAAQVRLSDVKRFLGYPQDHKPLRETLDLIQSTRQWVDEHLHPKVFFRTLEVKKTDDSGLMLCDGGTLGIPALSAYAKSANLREMAFGFVTLGHELQSASSWDKDPVFAYFLDAFSNALMEGIVSWCQQHLQAKFPQKTVLAQKSPGNLDWPLADQKPLFDFLCKIAPQETQEITLNDSTMLSPQKSILVVFGIGEQSSAAKEDYVSCKHCFKVGCKFRRKDEDGTDAGADYEYPLKALEKWSRQFLKQVEPGHFVFDYEGTTCSSLGMPFRLRYHVALNGDALGVMSVSQIGQESDWSYMCQAQKDPKFFEQISKGPELENRSLRQILNWNPEVRPCGCLCKDDRRLHKWKIVLQTLHYEVYGRGKLASKGAS